MHPQPLTGRDLLRTDHPSTTTPAKCGNCKSTRPQYVPKPEDVPAPLRSLPKKVVAALSPLEVDAGPVVRSRVPGTKSDRTALGYRQHTAMTRFARNKDAVKNRVRKLCKKSGRKTAKAALRYLLASDETSYRKFYNGHQDFLSKTRGCRKKCACAFWCT